MNVEWAEEGRDGWILLPLFRGGMVLCMVMYGINQCLFILWWFQVYLLSKGKKGFHWNKLFRFENIYIYLLNSSINKQQKEKKKMKKCVLSISSAKSISTLLTYIHLHQLSTVKKNKLNIPHTQASNVAHLQTNHERWEIDRGNLLHIYWRTMILWYL